MTNISDPVIITVKGEKPEGKKVFPTLEFNLSADTVIAGDEVTASWDALEGAQSYKVEVYADKLRVIASLRDTVTSTHCNINTAGLPAGRYTVSVEPVGDNYSTKSDFCVSRSFFIVTPADPNAVLKLPANLTVVGDDAFEGSAAQGVVLPESCNAIGSRAFANCKNLVEIHLPNGIRSIADDAFRGSDAVVFYCQANSVAERYAQNHGIAVAHVS